MAESANNKIFDHRKTTHLFPAFVPEYLGIETRVLVSYGIDFNAYLKKASGITGEQLEDFDIATNNFLGHQLKSQYIPYIISCCVSDILHKKDFHPAYVTSYSMGIYAALYHCRSIDFGTGLLMIKTAYESIEKNLPGYPTSMCVLGGLSRDDVNGLIRPFQSDVFIINQNSEFSFLLSGNKVHLAKVLADATAMGAMQARMLPVSHPYHARVLEHAAARFQKALMTLEIGTNQYKYVSAIDNRIILNREDIIEELTKNLFHGFDWYKTFMFLQKNGVDTFIECGAGESLYKMGKFIEGDFKIYNLKKIQQLC
jgi:[acyl-carrier-protein] S-malonyltransferase